MADERRKRFRCAIYTRKSTEDGLEQEFNSLDAQREACVAYITSQRHEGWEQLSDFYDDGGFSGGTMERPGLKQLLADVEAGRVDIIIVYKVDRLTRSLSDFARIVDVLDRKGASFVSVTQSFNTTTSMGRLTLNVLLSFAQFEREVTGERIRDKIAASKAKGMWMGGPTPLGYDAKDRTLIINECEAVLKRCIPPASNGIIGNADPALVRLLAHSFAARRSMMEGSTDPLLANYSENHLAKLVRLSWLAPDIVEAIISGRQPGGLTGRRLLRIGNLPIDWSGQRSALGFA